MGRLLFQATWGSHVQAEDVFREANERVAAKAGELKFAHPLPFLCECRDRHCFGRISLTLEEYEQVRSDPRRYLTIPGHETGASHLPDVQGHQLGLDAISGRKERK
jgi:hypothetical protein